MNDHRLYGILPPAKHPPPPPSPATVTGSTTVKTSTGSRSIEMTSSNNKLLAGYMAHEFRTKGTVLGRRFGSDGGESPERGRLRPVAEMRSPMNGDERYKEITSLIMVKSDGGVHIPGVVNPTQLDRWIQMLEC